MKTIISVLLVLAVGCSGGGGVGKAAPSGSATTGGNGGGGGDTGGGGIGPDVAIAQTIAETMTTIKNIPLEVKLISPPVLTAADPLSFTATIPCNVTTVMGTVPNGRAFLLTDLVATTWWTSGATINEGSSVKAPLPPGFGDKLTTFQTGIMFAAGSQIKITGGVCNGPSTAIVTLSGRLL